MYNISSKSNKNYHKLILFLKNPFINRTVKRLLWKASYFRAFKNKAKNKAKNKSKERFKNKRINNEKDKVFSDSLYSYSGNF